MGLTEKLEEKGTEVLAWRGGNGGDWKRERRERGNDDNNALVKIRK